MPRPTTKKVSPRQITPGLVIRAPKNGVDDAVRDVYVVLRLQNGAELTYNADEDEVALLEDQPQLVPLEEITPTTGD